MDPALSGLVGTWTVKFKHWTWEYTLTGDGRATWRDPLNGQTGHGTFGKAPKVIFFTWANSKTKESWTLPISDSMKGWVDASYGTGASTAVKKALTDAEMISFAFDASRAALRVALARLRGLQEKLNAIPATEGPVRSRLLTDVRRMYSRDIAVLRLRLVLEDDPTSSAFLNALSKSIELINQNLTLPNTIKVSRNAGFCADPRPSFAWTTIGRKPPNTELCTNWVNAKFDLRRDVITHEYFHTGGLLDISVNNTDQGLRNANTMAQVVAFLADRNRQVQSDGAERANPPLPSP